MNLRLTGKVAIVTGASRGIGRSIAQVLALEGMRLVLVARSQDQLNEVALPCQAESLVHVADLRNPDEPDGVVTAAIKHYGQIDLLVNYAGATKRSDFKTLLDAEWDDGFALKFFGAMRLCRATWPHLKKQMSVARFGEPEEIAHMVAFLASPLADYCHGSIIDIDGGQTRTL